MKGDRLAALFYIFVSMKRFLLFLLLLAAFPAAAQVATATLGGRIFDGDGPIDGVTVVAIHQTTNTQYYATTNAHGWWQMLDVLPGGPYTLRIHYFGYDPLTVRGLFTYIGQNIVVDTDLEAGQSYVHTDEAATSLRAGAALVGGTASVSPVSFTLVEQEIVTPVPFDVRQEAPLAGASKLRTTPYGSTAFHGSAYGYYGGASMAGVSLSTPVAGEDYLLFAGLQYDGLQGITGAARFDARLNADHRLDVSGGRLSQVLGAAGCCGAMMGSYASAGLTSSFFGGSGSNRAQALWAGSAVSRELLVSDDFTYSSGPQRLLFGVQVGREQFMAGDSAATHFDFYVQDVVRLGRRMTLQGGIRFVSPFAFSPRVSLYYDVTGTGAVVLRAGTAVYGVAGEGSVWKNLAAVDTRLPGKFYLTLEGTYGQSWRKLFYISMRNILDSRYTLTARLERPLAEGTWAVASYTRADGDYPDRVLAGLSSRITYGRLASTAAVLYTGNHFNGPDPYSSMHPAPEVSRWENAIEARLSQDFTFEAAGRDHTLQVTAYMRRGAYSTPVYYLFGLRYLL